MTRSWRSHTPDPSACALATMSLAALAVSLLGCGLDGPLSDEAFRPTGPLSIALDLPMADTYIGERFELRPMARGGVAPFEWDAQGLPGGLALDPDEGTIKGEPSAEGFSEVWLSVRDARGARHRLPIVLSVWSMPIITTSRLSPGLIDKPYEATLSAIGGKAPRTWPSITGLPEGLRYDQQRGIISGTPRREGTFGLLVSVRDANGRPHTRALPLNIARQSQNLSASVKLVGESTLDLAGFSVAGVGDVNDDGHGDVIVGAPGRLKRGSGAGALTTARGGAYLAYGPIGANLKLLDATIELLGEAQGDSAGFAVAGGGDLNGDGVQDLLIGAPNESSGGWIAGMAYVIQGPVERAINLLEADARLIGEHEGDQAGTALAIVGDLNGDGFDDLALGAPGSDRGGEGAGAVYLFYGPVQGVLRIGAADAILTGEHKGDAAGVSLSGAGDVNGDGFDDLIVGTRQGDAGLDARSVAAYLVYGPTEGERSLRDAGVALLHEASRSGQAYQVSGAGDVNGDGFDDILVSGLLQDTGSPIQGVCLFYGPIDHTIKLGDAPAKLIERAHTTRLSVSGAGDVNGDGFDDIIVGNPFADHDHEDSGAVYIVHGPMLGTQALQESSDALFKGNDPYDHVGFSVASIGDLNGDGFDDVVVGSPQLGGPGAAYLLYGSAQ